MFESEIKDQNIFLQHPEFHRVKFSVLSSSSFLLMTLLKRLMSFFLFADALKLLAQINNVNDCIRIQRHLGVINSWCKVYCLELNVSKSNTRKINGTTLNRSELVKELGIYFDRKLSFGPYIERIVFSSFKTLSSIVRKMQDLDDIATCKILYCTFGRFK